MLMSGYENGYLIMKVCLYVIVSFTLLMGCTSLSNEAPTTLVLNAEHAEPPSWRLDHTLSTPYIAPEQIFALSPEQEKAFLTYFNSTANQSIAPHQRLVNYLEHIVSSFSYKGSTLVAEQSLNEQNGNCLSLAIMTTALARIANVDVRYQKVHSRPIYNRLSTVITSSTHVRTFVLPKRQVKDNTILLGGWIVVDYFPSIGDDKGEYISENDFISMFYHNRAAEALGNQDLLTAYGFLEQAMRLNRFNAETLNYLAVLHKQKGNEETAQEIYQYVLSELNESLNAMYNYSLLLLQQNGNEDHYTHMKHTFDNLNDDNPYRWIDLGNLFYSNEEYRRAIVSYKKAIEHAPYLSEGYAGLAGAYFLTRKYGMAKRYMQQAIALTPNAGHNEMYSAKLEALSQALD